MSRSSGLLGKDSPRTFKEFWVELHPDWVEFGDGGYLTDARWNELEPESLGAMKREYIKIAELFGWSVSL